MAECHVGHGMLGWMFGSREFCVPMLFLAAWHTMLPILAWDFTYPLKQEQMDLFPAWDTIVDLKFM